MGADALPLSLRNTEGLPGSLNNKAGADFVQKEVIAPRDGGFDALPAGLGYFPQRYVAVKTHGQNTFD